MIHRVRPGRLRERARESRTGRPETHKGTVTRSIDMMGENTSLGTSKLAIIVVTMVALSTMVLHGAEATTYVVGDSVGWRVPPSTNTYSNWSSSYNFSVGDILGNNHVP